MVHLMHSAEAPAIYVLLSAQIIYHSIIRNSQ